MIVNGKRERREKEKRGAPGGLGAGGRPGRERVGVARDGVGPTGGVVDGDGDREDKGGKIYMR
ncbi:hypothetical protein TIFTF001_052966 [Ficus carica]|uniref:Uncharacterized protein n=1 Tax=Ficus carica TaxID=3494 RepID=A0AA88EEE0_FICCA|nr:hypothetical protein TIFTF001_052966 [Ficus carica]